MPPWLSIRIRMAGGLSGTGVVCKRHKDFVFVRNKIAGGLSVRGIFVNDWWSVS
jgi:hypothetical protein